MLENLSINRFMHLVTLLMEPMGYSETKFMAKKLIQKLPVRNRLNIQQQCVYYHQVTCRLACVVTPLKIL